MWMEVVNLNGAKLDFFWFAFSLNGHLWNPIFKLIGKTEQRLRNRRFHIHFHLKLTYCGEKKFEFLEKKSIQKNFD